MEGLKSAVHCQDCKDLVPFVPGGLTLIILPRIDALVGAHAVPRLYSLPGPL